MAQNLKAALKNKLKGAERIAVLGVGSELRGDDAAGLLIAEQLKCLSEGIKGRALKVLIGGTAPENLTSEIKRFKPDCLIIIDSAEMGKPAGQINLLEPGQIGGISFSTHSLPLKVMVDYLKTEIEARVVVIGIQPKNLAFGSLVTENVKDSAIKVSRTIKELLEE